jgi:hypothetical protein
MRGYQPCQGHVRLCIPPPYVCVYVCMYILIYMTTCMGALVSYSTVCIWIKYTQYIYLYTVRSDVLLCMDVLSWYGHQDTRHALWTHTHVYTYKSIMLPFCVCAYVNTWIHTYIQMYAHVRTNHYHFLLFIDIFSWHQLFAHVLFIQPHELILTHGVIAVKHRALPDLVYVCMYIWMYARVCVCMYESLSWRMV